MSDIAMVCLDIDGTLLNSRHELTQRTKRAVRLAAFEKGIHVVLVSARMPKGMLFLKRELGIKGPMVCYSGGLIWNEGIVREVAIPPMDAREIADLVQSRGLHLSVYRNDEWYVEAMDEWATKESRITKITPVPANFKSLWNVWTMDNTGPNKFLVMAEPKEIELLRNLRQQSVLLRGVNLYPSKPTYLEITHQDATKTSAIEYLAQSLGIRRSDILAIGDNFNDIDMLTFAGIGIAMGNAPQEVKRHADEVTLTNDEDGVADAIFRHLLE